jgi:hypothetical protein
MEKLYPLINQDLFDSPLPQGDELAKNVVRYRLVERGRLLVPEDRFQDKQVGLAVHLLALNRLQDGCLMNDRSTTKSGCSRRNVWAMWQFQQTGVCVANTSARFDTLT